MASLVLSTMFVSVIRGSEKKEDRIFQGLNFGPTLSATCPQDWFWRIHFRASCQKLHSCEYATLGKAFAAGWLAGEEALGRRVWRVCVTTEPARNHPAREKHQLQCSTYHIRMMLRSGMKNTENRVPQYQTQWVPGDRFLRQPDIRIHGHASNGHELSVCVFYRSSSFSSILTIISRFSRLVSITSICAAQMLLASRGCWLSYRPPRIGLNVQARKRREQLEVAFDSALSKWIDSVPDCGESLRGSTLKDFSKLRATSTFHPLLSGPKQRRLAVM